MLNHRGDFRHVLQAGVGDDGPHVWPPSIDGRFSDAGATGNGFNRKPLKSQVDA